MGLSREIPFRVDIAGIIEIMGSSLYSRADTPVRELLQNAHDAIVRRRRSDLSYTGRIDVQQDREAGTISFSDDGIGLTADDAEKYLGTLGIGITGLLKGRGTDEQRNEAAVAQDGNNLIGQFGIGLFSAFMLADRMVVESRRSEDTPPVRWEAGAGTNISLSDGLREAPGTTVTLHVKDQYRALCEDEELLEKAIREFADFLTVPIHLNGRSSRVNVIHVAWFAPTPDQEAIELELAGYFNESPLDVIPIRLESPVSIAGALYVSPQRTPGLTDDATVAVTVRRMVISRHIRGLIPEWAPFLRGVLELEGCSPTASREELVRDKRFDQVCHTLSETLFRHFEKLAQEQPGRLEAIVNWHRYTLAAACLSTPRLRRIVKSVYRWQTSRGQLTFDEIRSASRANPLLESEADEVIWFNADRRQVSWMDELFSHADVPVVHTLRSFEDSLLAALIGDVQEAVVDLRTASASSANFAESIMGMDDVEEVPKDFAESFGITDADIMLASFDPKQPVMTVLNERYELARSFDHLKQDGDIPKGFQRLIDAHFRDAPTGRNEVFLNRNHPIVKRVLKQGTRVPLAAVLRILVTNALSSAGAAVSDDARSSNRDDLEWIAEALWGRDE